MATPDFVVIGHVARDIVPGGWRLGGTAAFAAVQARRLRYAPGVVTRTSPAVDLPTALPHTQFAGRASITTTCFENVYADGERTQRVPEQAEWLSMEDVPAAWRAVPIVLVGGLCGEVPPNTAFEMRKSETIGVSAQGWLREVDPETKAVRKRTWHREPFWRGAGAVFASEEDLEPEPAQAEVWAAETPIVAITRAGYGARVAIEARWQAIDAYPADQLDPTGAGDVFATAFLIRYHETRDPAEATRFAAAAASCSVEGTGIERIASRAEIEERMREHPEIALR